MHQHNLRMHGMRDEPHNPDYKLISRTIATKDGFVEQVYGVNPEKMERGLEVYYYKDGANHFHYSRRWAWDEIPSKYQDDVLYLMVFVNDCPLGHKLYMPGHKLNAA